MDVDGVLTDGKFLLVPMPDGSVVEAKAFDSADGAGLAIARKCGIRLGVISGRSTPAVTRRAHELQMEYVYLGLGSRKLHSFEEILSKDSIKPETVCYVGDDVQDLPILRRVGFPVGVANACEEVKRAAAYVTRRSGGNGALREVVEFILRSQQKWETALSEFIDT
jgi:3-deoxy-D-manno-octulosonate 8-phosphate phosphatase (KDO 8-P phosphatase)